MPYALVPLALVCLIVLGLVGLWCVLPPDRFTRPWRRVVGPIATQYQAEKTARKLLKASLGPEEYARLEERGYLEVPSPSRPERVYRIPYGPGRVAVYDHGRFSMSLCVQPIGWLPSADLVLMHKLHIQANEAQYLKTANQLRYG